MGSRLIQRIKPANVVDGLGLAIQIACVAVISAVMVREAQAMFGANPGDQLVPSTISLGALAVAFLAHVMRQYSKTRTNPQDVAR